MVRVFKSDQICKDIETLVETKRVNYIDAVVMYCDQHQLDTTDIPKFLNDKIKAEIEIEAEGLNIIPKKSRL